MKCKYCHSNLIFSHREYENNAEYMIFECHFCQVQLFFYFDKLFNISKIMFLLDKNQKTYYVVQNNVEKSLYIILCDHTTNKGNRLINVPHAIDLHPTTVMEKFNFYMAFS